MSTHQTQFFICPKVGTFPIHGSNSPQLKNACPLQGRLHNIYVPIFSPIRRTISCVQPANTKMEAGSRTAKKTPLSLKRTGMNVAMVLSEELQYFTGEEMLSRARVVAKIGDYIRRNNLYVQGDKKRFICDITISNLLKVEGCHMFLHLQKLVGPHLKHPSTVGPEYELRSKRMFEQYLKERGAIDRSLVSRRKDPRGRNSAKAQQELQSRGLGMYAEVELQPCLRTLCNGREKMSRPQVLKAVWKYIKDQGLQCSDNRRLIMVDDCLRQGLQIEKDCIDCFHVSRYVWKLCGPAAKSEKKV